MQNADNITLAPKINRLHQALIALLILIYAGPFLFLSDYGPDFGNYLDWARAARFADIFQLTGDTLSPMRVPLTQWSHGPGLIFASGDLILGHWMDDNHSALVINGIGLLVFWWAMFHILHRAADGNFPLTVFGLAITFLGTHAGFYSNFVASESIAYPFFALLVLWLITLQQWRTVDLLMLGSVAGILITIRSQLALYALPSLIIAWVFAIETREAASPSQKVRRLIFLLSPVMAAVLAVAITNRWMTGSFYHSVYSFGSGSFKSFDLAHPEFFAVLVHPWRGLLTYHPLYGLGFIALIVRIMQTDSLLERVICGITATVVLIHLYIHASWYGWWMGTGDVNFGIRGMAITAVVLVPGLVRVMAHYQKCNPAVCRAWIWVSFATCLWSYCLLMSSRVSTYTYAEFFELFRIQALLVFPNWLLIVFCLGLILVWVFWRMISNIRRNIQRDHLAELPALLLSAVIMNYLLFALFDKLSENGLLPTMSFQKFYSILGIIFSLSLSTAMIGLGFLFKQGYMPTHVLDRPLEIIRWGTVSIFIVSLALFFNLAVRTENHIAEGFKLERIFKKTSTFSLGEAHGTYLEYLEVPGFMDKKRKLYLFLREQGIKRNELPLPLPKPTHL